ncbi:MAG: amino acid ABC transporter substrate-binding protein [Marinobacter sp.]|uniref:amino acid ABC transporter substrate-binding protein n=1 Tax=Marinobacter sp. TaxID=50741 RepID=UPI003297FC93
MNLTCLTKTAFLYSGPILALALGFITNASAETEIAVGVYNFPPVAAVRDNDRADGLLGDILAELDAAHSDLTFRIVHTSPKRRHLDFEAGLYDVIFFESLNWGWESLSVEATRPVLTDQDIYVALNKPDRDQSFFDNIADRTIVAISGYHYGFAGLTTDDAELEERFQIEFSHSHDRNLNLIKADRPSLAEVAVINRSYLQMYLKQHPEDKDRFLVSEVTDQTYQLRILTRIGGPLQAVALEQLLMPLIEDGRYQQMVEHHGLLLPPELASN